MTAPDHSNACVAALDGLVASLRAAAPRLNADLPYPDRMAITHVAAGDLRQDMPNRCSTVLTLHAGDASKSYRVELVRERERLSLTVSDEADFEERLMLATQPGEPPHPRDMCAFYDVLATDIAGHFGTDS